MARVGPVQADGNDLIILLGAAALLMVFGPQIIGAVAKQAVLSIGDGVGIPRTDLTKCEAAKRTGNTWDASFYCDAVDFAEWEREKFLNYVKSPFQMDTGPDAASTIPHQVYDQDGNLISNDLPYGPL